MTLFEVLAAVFVLAVTGGSAIGAFFEVNRVLSAAEESRWLVECAEGTAERWLAGLPIRENQVVDGRDCRSEVVTELVSGQRFHKVVAQDEVSRVYLWLPDDSNVSH